MSLESPWSITDEANLQPCSKQTCKGDPSNTHSL